MTHDCGTFSARALIVANQMLPSPYVHVFALQLMFSNAMDPPSVTAARNLERQYMHMWIEEATDAYRTQAKQ